MRPRDVDGVPLIQALCRSGDGYCGLSATSTTSTAPRVRAEWLVPSPSSSTSPASSVHDGLASEVSSILPPTGGHDRVGAVGVEALARANLHASADHRHAIVVEHSG